MNTNKDKHIRCLTFQLNAVKKQASNNVFKIIKGQKGFIICGGEIVTAANGNVLGFNFKCLDCPFLCLTDEQIELYKADLRPQEMEKTFYFDNNPTLKISKRNLNFKSKARIKNDNELFDKIKTIE